MVVHNHVGCVIDFNFRLVDRNVINVAKERCEFFERLVSGCKSQKMDR